MEIRRFFWQPSMGSCEGGDCNSCGKNCGKRRGKTGIVTTGESVRLEIGRIRVPRKMTLKELLDKNGFEHESRRGCRISILRPGLTLAILTGNLTTVVKRDDVVIVEK